MVYIEKFNAGFQLANQCIVLGVPIADGMSHRKLVQMTSCVCNRE